MFKVTVSGDYRTSGGKEGNIVDFEGVVGIMPECGDQKDPMDNEDIVRSHVVARYLGAWIKADKRFTARYADNRTTNIDKIERVPGTPSFIGKDIKTLSWEELQDLAVAKNLLRIPVAHAVDLRSARETAYVQYSRLILSKEINVNNEEYSFIKLPELIVSGDSIAQPEETISNEDVLGQEQEGSGTFTIEELREMAKDKGIKFPPALGYKKLEALVLAAK